MKIYLARHGDAAMAGSDAARHLSPKGKADSVKTSKFLKNSGIKINVIWHSSKTRAFQTAQVFSETFGGHVTTEIRAGLDPDDPPEAIYEEIMSEKPDGLLIVGHLPFVNRLAGLLLSGGVAQLEPLHFEPCTITAFEHKGGTQWRMEWVLVPELIP